MQIPKSFSKTDGQYIKTVHPQLELVLSGRANITIDCVDYAMKSGMFIVYPQYTLYRMEDRSEDFKSVWVDCNFEDIYNYELLYNLTIVDNLDSKHLADIKKYFDILQETACYDDATFKSVKYIIVAFIHLISVNIEAQRQNQKLSERSYEICRNFWRLLRRNYDFSLTIDDYAEQLCISKSYLRNVVKKITGCSIIKLVDAEIISKAKILLSEDMSAKDVAAKLHLKDSEYFYQFFNRETGITTSDFRELKKRL